MGGQGMCGPRLSGQEGMTTGYWEAAETLLICGDLRVKKPQGPKPSVHSIAFAARLKPSPYGAAVPWNGWVTLGVVMNIRNHECITLRY